MKSCKNCIYKTKKTIQTDDIIPQHAIVYECDISNHDITDRVENDSIPPKCTEHMVEDTRTPSLFK